MTAVATGKSIVTGNRRVRTGGDRAVETTSHVLLAVWSVIVIVPFLWVVLSSFKTTKEILASPFSLAGYLQATNF